MKPNMRDRLRWNEGEIVTSFGATDLIRHCDGRWELSGLRHKYDDVRCAQFGLWRGARRAHPRPGAVTDEQRSHRPNSAQPGGRQVFFAQTSLLAPYRSTAGYARRSRLVWAKNPLPRTSSCLCLRPLRMRLPLSSVRVAVWVEFVT